MFISGLYIKVPFQKNHVNLYREYIAKICSGVPV